VNLLTDAAAEDKADEYIKIYFDQLNQNSSTDTSTTTTTTSTDPVTPKNIQILFDGAADYVDLEFPTTEGST
jgi:hypothetical protein